MRYLVYDKNGNFAQSYSLELGEEKALKYAKYTCERVEGRVLLDDYKGNQEEVLNNLL